MRKIFLKIVFFSGNDIIWCGVFFKIVNFIYKSYGIYYFLNVVFFDSIILELNVNMSILENNKYLYYGVK